MKHILLTLFMFAVVNAEKKSYNGFKLYKVTPKSEAAVGSLQYIRDNGLGEFWDDYLAVNLDLRVNVSPKNLKSFLDVLNSSDIESQELISDIQSAIDEQTKPVSSRSSVSYLSYSWDEYHSLERIYDWLDELQENHPNVVKTVVKGTSVLGNPIKGIIINFHPERSEKLIGIIEGTLHAREWIATATVTWIIKEFLTSTNAAVRAMAEDLEWHVFPVINPDGYNYTFTDNRMWRKNRSPASFTSCPDNDDNSNGVDLNRNFDFYWMSVGASNNPCSNLYAGPSAFSEPEARAIRDYTMRVHQEGRLIYYLAYHSWGNMFVIPYSHITPEDSLLSRNYPDMVFWSFKKDLQLLKCSGNQHKCRLSISKKVYSKSFDSSLLDTDLLLQRNLQSTVASWPDELFEIAIRASDAIKQRFGTEYRAGLSYSVLSTEVTEHQITLEGT